MEHLKHLFIVWQFPINDFNIYNIQSDDFSDSNIQRDDFSEFDEEVEQINNDIKADLERLNTNRDIPKAEVVPKKIKQTTLPSRKLRPQKPGETKEEYDKYVNKSIKNRENYQKRKTEIINFTNLKVISEKELELKIPELSEEDINKFIEITNKLREQKKNITQQEEDVFKSFSL